MSFFHWCNLSVVDTPCWICLPTYESRDYWPEQQHTLLFCRREQAWKHGKSLPMMSELQNIHQQGSPESQLKEGSVNDTSDDMALSMPRPSVIMHTSKINEEKAKGSEAEGKGHIPPLRLKLSWSNDEMTSSDELDDEEEDRGTKVFKLRNEPREPSFEKKQSLHRLHEKDTLQWEQYDLENIRSEKFACFLDNEVASAFLIPQHEHEEEYDSHLHREKSTVFYESVIKWKDLHQQESSIGEPICSESKTGTADDIAPFQVHYELNEQIKEVLQRRLQYYLSYFRRHSISNIDECMQILERNLLTLFPVSTVQSQAEKEIRAKILYILQEHDRKACNMKNESECKCAFLLGDHFKTTEVADFTNFDFFQLEKRDIRDDNDQEPCREGSYSVCTQSKSTYHHKVGSTSKAIACLKTYTCEFCSKTFKHEPSYEKHLLTHKGKRTFRCFHCSRSFYHDTPYQRHLKSHTGEKPHQCNYCNMAFCKKSALKVHLRTHTGHQPYSCNYCSKSFSISGNLQRHLLIHTGQRPYKCGKCPKTFNNPSHLARHITSAHVD